MTTRRSIRIAGRPTSVALEPEFWRALEALARRRGVSVPALVRDLASSVRGNRASVLRTAVLTLQGA